MKIKTLFTQLISFIVCLFSKKAREEKDLEDINDKLFGAVRDQEIERALLKAKITKYVKKQYGVKLSKYIPRKGFNTAEVYESVNNKYGQDMQKLSLTLNRNLTWK